MSCIALGNHGAIIWAAWCGWTSLCVPPPEMTAATSSIKPINPREHRAGALNSAPYRVRTRSTSDSAGGETSCHRNSLFYRPKKSCCPARTATSASPISRLPSTRIMTVRRCRVGGNVVVFLPIRAAKGYRPRARRHRSTLEQWTDRRADQSTEDTETVHVRPCRRALGWEIDVASRFSHRTCGRVAGNQVMRREDVLWSVLRRVHLAGEHSAHEFVVAPR